MSMYCIKVKALQGSEFNIGENEYSVKYVYRNDFIKAEQLRDILKQITPYNVSVEKISKIPKGATKCYSTDKLWENIRKRLISAEVANVVEEDKEESIIIKMCQGLKVESWVSDLEYTFFRIKHDLFKLDMDNIKDLIQRKIKESSGGILDQGMILYSSRNKECLYFKKPINKLYNKQVRSVEYRDDLLIINYTIKQLVNKGRITKVFEY